MSATVSHDRLPRSFYLRDVVRVARSLLGQKLVRVHQGRRLAGVIVETEAYLGVEDLAAHTVGGRRTARNQSMWKVGGSLYVYFTYGMHHCMNVVAQPAEQPVAVLIRALEPVEGVEAMRAHRSARGKIAKKNRLLTDLCSGPAKLCQALAIDRQLDGVDLTTSNQIFIERLRCRAFSRDRIAQRPRVGVAYAGAWADRLLRFYLKGNPYISRP